MEKGDIIDMFVSFDDLSVRYSLNEQDQGIAFKINHGEYRAAITLSEANTKIRLLSYCQLHK